jgi:uncharacterized protein YjbJ (UPF0337 family)
MDASAQNAADLVRSLADGGCRTASSALPTTSIASNRRNTMNKDQSKGRVEEIKGKVKEVAGKVTGNKEMEVKGKVQNIKGQAQAAYGDLKEDIKKSTS